MKTEHQPMQAKPAALKPAVPKLELELDDNATHVHRIPKELINRLREREQPQPQPQPPAQDYAADDDEEPSHLLPFGMVQEDRTAVFRPPPELLARAKRMKPPVKPDAQASVPTKPPPASQAELLQSLPASGKVPAFESVPAAAKGGFASVPLKSPLTSSAAARTPMPAVAQAPMPAVQSAAAVAHAHAAASFDFAEPLAVSAELAPAPASGRAPDSSAVFARREAGSGVLPVAAAPASLSTDDNDEPATREYTLPELGLGGSAPVAQPAAFAETESPFAFEPSSVVPIVPPTVEVTGPLPVEAAPESEEASAPTTHAPVVRAEPSVAPEPATPLAVRALLFVVVALAAAAVAWWRYRHF